MEPVLGGGPLEWTGGSGQEGGHVMEQANPASQSRGLLGIGKKEEVHECSSRSL